MEHPEAQLIGEKIRKARMTAKLTLKNLSKKTGIGYSTLSRIESGKKVVNVIELKRIANTVNKPITYFFQEGNNIVEYYYPPLYRK